MSLNREDFIGAWKLEAKFTEDEGGNRAPALGDNPQGMIIYTADGHMAAMTGFGDREMPPGDADAPQKAAAFDSYMNYAGRWELRGDAVVHTIELATNPNWIGTTRERAVDHQGDRMVFSGLAADGKTRAVIIWRRAA